MTNLLVNGHGSWVWNICHNPFTKWIMVSVEITTITSESNWTCSQVFLQKWNNVRQIVHKPLNIAVCDTSRENNKGIGCIHTILQQRMDCVCSCFMNVTHSYGFPPQSSLWFSNKMAFQSKANRPLSRRSKVWTYRGAGSLYGEGPKYEHTRGAPCMVRVKQRPRLGLGLDQGEDPCMVRGGKLGLELGSGLRVPKGRSMKWPM